MLEPVSLLPRLEEIIREAGSVAVHARKALKREIKDDGSIVTNGDREVETYLRGVLPDLVPGATFWGEEFGREAQGSDGLWLVDPVDGTSNFAYGSPLWGVSIALAKGDDVLLGAVYLPDLDELYLSATGHGVTLNGAPLAPIPPGPIAKYELVSFGSPILRLYNGERPPGRMRLSGAFVIDGAFTVTQRYRGLIGRNERLYDVAPCILFGRELGADIRYLDGSPMLVSELMDGRKIEPWVIFPMDSGVYWPARA